MCVYTPNVRHKALHLTFGPRAEFHSKEPRSPRTRIGRVGRRGHDAAQFNVHAEKVNGNGTLDSCEVGCGADFNADGFLDPDDLADFITFFFLEAQMPGTCPSADFNNDAFRDPDDLADFITVFFTCG